MTPISLLLLYIQCGPYLGHAYSSHGNRRLDVRNVHVWPAVRVPKLLGNLQKQNLAIVNHRSSKERPNLRSLVSRPQLQARSRYSSKEDEIDEAWDVWGTDKIIALSESQLKELDDMGWWSSEELLECLQTFKSLHGDGFEHGLIQVPSGFQVPSEDPWPIACWELRLGEHLNLIRRGSYIDMEEKKIKGEMEAMGFNWNTAEYSFDDLLLALQSFKDFTNGVDVPENFVIPSSLTVDTSSLIDQSPSQKLEQRWPLRCAGLSIGRELNRIKRLKEAHPMIATSETNFFITNSDDTENARVLTPMEKLHKLEELGFLNTDKVYDISSSRGNEVAHSIEQFHTIDCSDRAEHVRPSKQKRKENIERWERFLDALTMYRDLCGDCDVPTSFIVPHEEPWPLSVRGLPLGSRVATTRSMGTYLNGDNQEVIDKRVEALNLLGFTWEYSESRWNLLIEAFAIFKEVFGHLMVPQDFVVPPLNLWPETMWGLKLGHRVNALRCGKRESSKYLKGRPDRIQQLRQMGFEWDIRDTTWNTIVQCLEIIKDNPGLMKKGADKPNEKMSVTQRISVVKVPRSFVVPETEPWPETAWGMPLGERCAKIRNRGDFILGDRERIQKLQSLNFYWGRGDKMNGSKWLWDDEDDDDDDDDNDVEENEEMVRDE
eukprot:CAMPEP_0184484124 /NCGR_PEP_ID=MMETSP0113_2-20130426/5833_1 /TAXON_ID=91329 /ORGANISM="Norrisiella sphaerica, Strain BC52" /LENGTH=658 /DNA_ID=CAMNT_0026864943 /DNA_START=153 /DNA_END=2129 /DNA_ORIENTATION=+